MKYLAIASLIIVISGCTSGPTSRYQMSQDQAPTRLPTMGEIADITPGYEAYSRGGNKDYTVRGISYQLLKNPVGYSEIGNASWYGSKFHGHLTSNGEIYNMYTLSAAHKTLPLPSFVRVTNLDNNKQIVVRVNDRGPFHPSRIIDLSYGAAYRLDMLKTGTTKVKVELLTFPSTVLQPQTTTEVAINQRCIVQLAATSNQLVADQQLTLVATKHQVPSQLEQSGQLYRMQLGPLSSQGHCHNLIKKVEQNYPKAFIKML